MAGRTIKSKTKVRELHKATRQALSNGREITFLLQDWEDAYNVGGMFRLADALGIRHIYMSGRTPAPPNPMIGVTSLGFHRSITYDLVEKHDEAARMLKEEGWSIVAVEIADGAINYREYDYPQKVCLVLGNEGRGVYSAITKQMEAAVYVPMIGKGRSLNVTVAAALVGYEALLKGVEE